MGAKILYPASGNQSGASVRVKGPGNGVYNGDSYLEEVPSGPYVQDSIPGTGNG